MAEDAPRQWGDLANFGGDGQDIVVVGNVDDARGELRWGTGWTRRTYSPLLTVRYGRESWQGERAWLAGQALIETQLTRLLGAEMAI